MAEDFDTYLNNIGFEKYFEKLKKKLGQKKVIIYGSGSFFRYIQEHYDFSGLNIIGISDMKFQEEQEGQDCLGYKIIPKDKIISYNPDYVLVATLEYIEITENFIVNEFDKTKIKVYPLARIPLLKLIKKIWER